MEATFLATNHGRVVLYSAMQFARGVEVVGGEADLAFLKCFDEACWIFSSGQARRNIAVVRRIGWVKGALEV